LHSLAVHQTRSAVAAPGEFDGAARTRSKKVSSNIGRYSLHPAGPCWSTISVELRSHGVTEVPAIVPQHVEICLVVAGNEDSLVRRTGAGLCQEAMPKTGAIWLSPARVGKEIVITAPIPQTMHLYLPTTLFDRLKDDFNLPVAPADSIRHAAGIDDDVIDQIGRSILSELTAATAASRVYVESASLTLAARLLQKHCDSGGMHSHRALRAWFRSYSAPPRSRLHCGEHRGRHHTCKLSPE